MKNIVKKYKEAEFPGTDGELKKRYEELQLRVTRFSAVEQQLINIKNGLDNEISMHERMHAFNKKGFTPISDTEFSKLVAEAVVDIFEVAVGLIIIYDTEIKDNLKLGVEGAFVKENDYKELHALLTKMSASRSSGNVVRLGSPDLQQLKLLIPLHQASVIQLAEAKSNLSLIIVAGIPEGRELLYDPLINEREIIFGVFAQQVLAQAVNRKKNQTIIDQVEKIDTSKNRLARITECFLNFGTSPQENILRLTELGKELMNANASVYYSPDYDTINCIGKCVINDNSNINCKRSFCSKLFTYFKDDSVRYYAPDDISKLKNNSECIFNEMNTCIGCAVMLNNKPKGFLAIIHNRSIEQNEDDRQLMQIIAAGIAVEERRNISMNALEESELRYRALFEGTPHGILIAEVDSKKIKYANTSLCDKLGYQESEILGSQLNNLLLSDSYEDVVKHINLIDSSKNNNTIEIPFIRKNGSIIHTELSSYKLMLDNVEHVASFVTDISERKQMVIDLIIAKEQAEESDRLKSAFLANMSHEIRTPMNGILGFSELLKNPELTGNEQQNYIRIIEKSGARMLDIINNIIDISKIESGQMKVDIRELNINEYIEYIYTFFKPEVESKGMHLFIKNTLPANESILKTDSNKFMSILTNLIKNAIKYSDNGSIEFGYNLIKTRHDEYIQFFVKDTGIGIPANRQEAIFERFIQADIVDKMARQGAGLGLAISKAYVEMLGGNIWVDSIEGFGSSFYFTLPYYAPLVNESVVPDISLSDDNIYLNISNRKILIVEDDEVSEMLIAIEVKKLSNEILIARSGIEAIDACRDNPDIDLILMDILMPEMNGYDATRKIRKFNKDVIIIAQTAFAQTGDREKSINAGCNDYISKPFNRNVFMAIIHKHLKKKISVY